MANQSGGGGGKGGLTQFLWQTFVRDPLDILREVEDGLFPTLEEEADVTVTLNPDGLRSDGYWIAVCTAFGLIVNRDLTGLRLPNGFIGMEYHAEENVIRFICRQESTWKGTLNSIRDPLGRYTLQLFGGPKNEVYGGEWQWYAGAVPGIPSKDTIGKLPYEGRSILTQFPTYADADGVERLSVNPVPPFDEQSRSVPGIAGDPRVKVVDSDYTYTHPHYLLFQALTGPCAGADKLTTPPSGSDLLDPKLLANPNPPQFAGPVT